MSRDGDAGREAEVARLRAAERRQRAIFDGAAEFATVATDRDGNVTSWNGAATRTLGWTADEMLGRTVEGFSTPDDRAARRAETEMRCALAHGRAGDERWHL